MWLFVGIRDEDEGKKNLGLKSTHQFEIDKITVNKDLSLAGALKWMFLDDA